MKSIQTLFVSFLALGFSTGAFATSDYEVIKEAILINDFDTVKRAVDQNTIIQLSKKYDRYIYWTATRFNELESLRLVLTPVKNSVTPSLFGSYGEDMDYISRSIEKTKKIAKLLLENGDDPTVAGPSKKTAIGTAKPLIEPLLAEVNAANAAKENTPINNGPVPAPYQENTNPNPNPILGGAGGFGTRVFPIPNGM